MTLMKELEALKTLAPILAIPFFAAACMVDSVFDHVGLPDHVVLRYLVLCSFVTLALFVTINGLELIDDHTGGFLSAIHFWQVLSYASLVVGFMGVLPVIATEFPPSPLHLFWHLGLFSFGVTLRGAMSNS